MLFAIVDIETTGSYAMGNGITEIAVIIHDGREVLHTYETLVNPRRPIPRFIQSLTGITDDRELCNGQRHHGDCRDHPRWTRSASYVRDPGQSPPSHSPLYPVFNRYHRRPGAMQWATASRRLP